MEQATQQICSEQPPFLKLNEDCLMEILQYLQLDDIVNLAQTCSQLLCVVQQSKNYKNIRVCRSTVGDSVEKISKILAVIGLNVASVYVGCRSFTVLKTMADNYTNVGIAELDSYYSGQLNDQLNSCYTKPLHGTLPFRNLKELKVGTENDISIDDWRNCFESNAGIESLEYWERGSNKCIQLLHMLPKLKTLRIDCLEVKPQEFHQLSCLTSVTKFSFTSLTTCNNQLLIRLAEKLQLLELEFQMPCDGVTCAIMKSFVHLNVLSMANTHDNFPRIIETTIFPTMLKKIKLEGIDLSCSVFLSIVKQLSLLQEFDLGDGEIFGYNNEAESFPSYRHAAIDSDNDIVSDSDDEDEYLPTAPYQPDAIQCIQSSKIICRVAKEVRAQKRKLKIIFDDLNDEEIRQVCKYSDNLEVIIRPRYTKKTLDHTYGLSINWMTNF